MLKGKEKISVIISAYDAPDDIKECIESIANQSYFNSFSDYEILLGIDGCVKTLDTVKTFMDSIKNLKVLYSHINSGPYLMFNTLVELSQNNIISVFGADDVMLPNFIEHNISLIEKKSFVIAMGSNFIGDKENIVRTYNPDGVIIFNKSDFMEVNGFESWRCGADSDLKIRFKLNELKMILSTNPTFLRRIHDNSLTSNEKYGMKSEYRAAIRKISRSREKSRISEFNSLKKYKIIK